jgi:polyvinyl alcohol dehydrogenase (cytochrome)
VLIALSAAALAAAAGASGAPGSDWTTYGYDPGNSRTQPSEHDVSPANAAQLAVKWVATTTGDVSGTPVVSGGAVYFGDFGGTVWKLDANSGAVIWSHSVSAYTGIAGDFARTSPSLDGNTLIVGTNKTPLLLGIDATTGALLWKTQVNPDLHGTMTGSPTLVGDTAITGVSAANASRPNATFRADVAAVDALTGRLLWESFSVPDNGGQPGGYAGATMFSAPAVDVADGLVFGTFGQFYTEPASVAACNAAAPNGFFSESCEQPGAFWKSIVALDLATGAAVWSYRVFGDGPWQSVCGPLPPQVTWCAPESDTEKWDIGGSSPNVFKLGLRTVVGFAGKSGVYYLFDAKTGSLIWNTLIGPGGDQGGFEWGTAYDGRRIYGSLTNQHHIPYDLTENGTLTNTVVTGGSWMALDPATGKILWQTADPQTETLPAPTGTVGVWDLAPVSAANGVVFTASLAKSGNQFYALDAATGSILWAFPAGSSVNAAPAVVDGSVYWGTGYARAAEGSGNNKLYAFSIGGVADATPPATTITLNPASPNGANGWYRTAVDVSVSAADNPGGVGVYQTRCEVDPASPPAGFDALPAGCPPASVGDGTHTVYAASEDRDNNVESPPVTRTFEIDATPPTITAAATTAPNGNGFYSGDVVVHFTCTDTGSGIPAGTCPPDQTLAGIGEAISSTPETVTDAAGNTSTRSNVVTVAIVNAPGLCDETRQDVHESYLYGLLRPVQRSHVDAEIDSACDALEALAPSSRPAALRRYDAVVNGLRARSFLTGKQARELKLLATGI